MCVFGGGEGHQGTFVCHSEEGFLRGVHSALFVQLDLIMTPNVQDIRVCIKLSGVVGWCDGAG